MLKKKTRPSEENVRLSLENLQNWVEITKEQKFEKIVKKVNTEATPSIKSVYISEKILATKKFDVNIFFKILSDFVYAIKILKSPLLAAFLSFYVSLHSRLLSRCFSLLLITSHYLWLLTRSTF